MEDNLLENMNVDEDELKKETETIEKESETEKTIPLEKLMDDVNEVQEEEYEQENLSGESNDIFDDTSEDENETKEREKENKEEVQEEALDDFEYQETRRILESTLVNHAAPESMDGELYYVKMPNFLAVVQKPFDSDSYLEEIRAEHEEAMVHSYDNNQRIRLRIENTIRWRYVKNDDGTYSKQSNARFLKWSDGSLSLLLGSELFSVVTKNSVSDHMYLSISHENQNLLMSRKRFTKNMTFLPIDTRSLTHKRLTEAILRGNMKKSSIVEFINVEDPEKVKREAERIEEEKIRFRRRLESKRRAQNARYNESPILTIEGLEAEEMDESFSTSIYKDDDDDGFIVDDESDEEERVERLRRVKEEGRNMYKKLQTSLTENNQKNENEMKNQESSLNEEDKDMNNEDYKNTDLDDNIVRRAGKRRRVVNEWSDEEPSNNDIKHSEQNES